MSRFLLFCCACLLCLSASGQTPEKNLESLIKRSSKLQSNNPDSSLMLAQQAEKLAREVNKPVFILQSQVGQAIALRFKPEFARSKALFEQIINQIETNFYSIPQKEERRLNKLRARSYFFLGSIQINQGINAQGLANGRKALNLFNELADSAMIRKTYSVLAAYHFNLGDLDSAVVYTELGIAGLDPEKHWKELATALANLGAVNKSRGNLPGALDNFLRALEVIDGRDSRKMARAYDGMGQVYYAQNDYSTSLRHFLTCIRIAEQVEDSWQVGFTSSNVADCYQEMGYLDSTRFYLDKSLFLRRQNNDLAGEAYVLERLADLFIQLGNIPEALKRIEEGLALAKEHNLLEELLYLRVAKSEAMMKLGRLKEAQTYADLAIEVAEQVEWLPAQMEAYEVAFLAHDTLGNSARALKYLKLFKGAEESIRNEEKVLELARIEHQFERKQQVIESEANLEREQRKTELAQQNAYISQLWMAIVGLGSLTLLVALFIGFRKRNQRLMLKERLSQLEVENKELESEQLRQSLALKEKDFSDLALSLRNKNELRKQFFHRLEQLLEIPPEELRREVAQLRQEVRHQLQMDAKSMALESDLETANQTFYHNLEQAYPGLTRAESELCGLLRLGFDGKQIAAMKGIEPNSVKTLRYRLRKKMKISPDQDLITLLTDL